MAGTEILDKQDVVVNSVVPDHPEIMVFAIPAPLLFCRTGESL